MRECGILLVWEGCALALERSDSRTQLQKSFGRLGAKQQEWLLARRYYKSDKECSASLGYSTAPQANWKRQGDFRLAYGLIQDGALDGMDEVLIEALAYANGMKALIEEGKIIGLTWDEASDQRLGSVKGGAVKDAIARVKPSKTVTEHVYTIEDLTPVIEGRVVDVQ